MTSAPQDLTGLIGSRICHDLISPIGAIGNGLELIEMQRGRSSELSLVSESCQNASARLRFFRIAFGAAVPGQEIPGAEIAQVLADISRGSRLTVDWAASGALDRREARLACLLVLCIETALPRGGTIRVSTEGRVWTLRGAASRIAPLQDIWDDLEGGRPSREAEPATVQVPLAILAARDLGRSLSICTSEGQVTISF